MKWSRKRWKLPGRIKKLFKIIRKEREEKNKRKGDETETRVLQVLSKMKNDGEITHFWQAKPDMPGVDFGVVFPEYGEIKFQVKSSKGGAQRHRKRYPHIPVIVATKKDSNEDIHQKILLLKTWTPKGQ